jgi:hypothetical protein
MRRSVAFDALWKGRTQYGSDIHNAKEANMMETLSALTKPLVRLLSEHPVSFAVIAGLSAVALGLIICGHRSRRCERIETKPDASLLRQLLGWLVTLVGKTATRIIIVLSSAVALSIATNEGWVEVWTGAGIAFLAVLMEYGAMLFALVL